VLAFLLLALLTGCAEPISLVERVQTWWDRIWNPPPYPMYDSGYFVDADAHPNRLYWLDNDRVIFSGDTHERGQRESRAGQRPSRRIHIWNVRTGEVSYYGEGVSPPCYHERFIFYLTRTDQEVFAYKEGRFGKELEVVKPGHGTPPDFPQGIPHRSVLDCRLYFPKDVPGPGDGWTTPLLHGHGFLSITGIGGKPRPAKLIKPASGEVVELPFNGDEVDGNRIQYAPWADAYLLYSDHQRWVSTTAGRKLSPPRVFLMFPSGKVTQLAVPTRTWFTASKGFVLTHAGLVLWSDATRGGGLGHAGLYLVDGELLPQLARGYLRGIGVSPDGCRVAAALQGNTSRLAELRAIDLCAKER
jgi:hypothetical protein